MQEKSRVEIWAVDLALSAFATQCDGARLRFECECVGVGVGVGVGVFMGVFMGAGSRPLRREFNKPKASPGVGGQMDGAGKVRIRRNAMT